MWQCGSSRHPLGLSRWYRCHSLVCCSRNYICAVAVTPTLKFQVGSTNCPSTCKAGVVRNVKVLLETGFRGSGSRGFRSPKRNNPPPFQVGVNVVSTTQDVARQTRQLQPLRCYYNKMWPGWQCGCYCQLPGLSDMLLDCCCTNTAANLAGRAAAATSRHPLCSLLMLPLTVAPVVPPGCSQQGVHKPATCNTRCGQYGGVAVARVVRLVTPLSSQNSVTHVPALLSCVTQKSGCFEAVWCCRCIGTCCPLGMQSAGPTTPFAYGICLQQKMWPLWQRGCCCQTCQTCYLTVVG